MTNKEELQYIYDYLSKKNWEYKKARKEKERVTIEYDLKRFVQNHFSGELYKEINVTNTNDELFSHGFFKVDLNRALVVIAKKLATEQ